MAPAIKETSDMESNSGMSNEDSLWELQIQRRTQAAAAKIRLQFLTLQRDLLEAQSEVAELRKEVCVWRAVHIKLNNTNTGVLRRQAARHLHPDRGGDGALMSKLNALLDELETVQTLMQEETDRAA